MPPYYRIPQGVHASLPTEALGSLLTVVIPGFGGSREPLNGGYFRVRRLSGASLCLSGPLLMSERLSFASQDRY